MKNAISILISATFLVFTSCTKADFPLPQLEVTQGLNTSVSDIDLQAPTNRAIETVINPVEKTDITTEQRVSVISFVDGSNDFTVDFTGSHDFSNSTVKTAQTLNFIDANGLAITLAVNVTNYVGSDGVVQITFDKGGNDLTGWTIVSVQEIVIDDIVIN